MAIQELDGEQVQAALQKDPQGMLVDVRSVPEFQGGHPASALNVPFMNAGPGGLQPNADFVAVMEKLVPKDRALYLTCASGNRSLRAAQALEQLGWKSLVNVKGGWGGSRNPLGQVTGKGWQALGLPTSSGDPADRCYEALRKKAGK